MILEALRYSSAYKLSKMYYMNELDIPFPEWAYIGDAPGDYQIMPYGYLWIPYIAIKILIYRMLSLGITIDKHYYRCKAICPIHNIKCYISNFDDYISHTIRFGDKHQHELPNTKYYPPCEF